MTGCGSVPLRVLDGVVVADAVFVAQFEAAGLAYRARPDDARAQGILDVFAWVCDLSGYAPTSMQVVGGNGTRVKLEGLLATELLQDGVIWRQTRAVALLNGYREPLVPVGTTRRRLEGVLITLLWMFVEDQPAPYPWPGVGHLPGVARRAG
jgi:hypothetical protein